MEKICMPLTIFATIMLVFLAAGQTAAQQTETLSVERTGDGSGTVTSVPAGINCGSDCSEAFKRGMKVTLKATPDVKSDFAGWTGACTTTKKTCVVTMSGNMSATAAFRLKEPTMELSTDTLDFGTVQTGDKLSQILQVKNTGRGDLDVQLSLPENKAFGIAGKPTATIKPNKSHNFAITLKVTDKTTGAAEVDADLETMLPGAKPKIIEYPLAVESNDPKQPQPAPDVTCLAELVEPRRAYEFEIKTEMYYDLDKEGGRFRWDLSGDSLIPFALKNGTINCHPAAASPYCEGKSSLLCLSGEFVDKDKHAKCKRCSIYGYVEYSWKLTGQEYTASGATGIIANLEVTKINDNTNMNCCGKIAPANLGTMAAGMMAGITASWDHKLEFQFPKRFTIPDEFEGWKGDVSYMWRKSPK